jgi:hypothetical protein
MPLIRLAAVLACALQILLVTDAFAQIGATPAQKSDPTVVQSVARSADIARVEGVEDGTKGGERIMVDVPVGSIECSVDPNATKTRVSAEFKVDGKDVADAQRRAKLVKLYAERAPDGTIIVDAMFPGAAMPMDTVKLAIVAPPTQELVLKSASGSVRARSTMGALRVSTKSGAIFVENHVGPVDARAASGRIEIKGARESVQATSASGAIDLALADGNDQVFTLESRSGAVRVEVGAGFDGVVTLASSSGALAVVDPAKRARIPQQSETRIVAEIGAAAAPSTIDTTSGAATLVVR